MQKQGIPTFSFYGKCGFLLLQSDYQWDTCSPRIFHRSKRFTVTFGTSDNGTWKYIYDGLYLAVHDRGWEESPMLAIIGAQFVRIGQNAHDNVGFDVRKNIKSRTSGILFSTTV